MQNLLPEHLLSRKKMIQFRIDESVSHFQIPISSNHGALFQITDQGQFQDLENFGGAERKTYGCR